MSSFYVTLPSNSSMLYFPNNTLTRFRTKLHTPIILKGNYEVSLVEITYPLKFVVLEEPIEEDFTMYLTTDGAIKEYPLDKIPYCAVAIPGHEEKFYLNRGYYANI